MEIYVIQYTYTYNYILRSIFQIILVLTSTTVRYNEGKRAYLYIDMNFLSNLPILQVYLAALSSSFRYLFFEHAFCTRCLCAVLKEKKLFFINTLLSILFNVYVKFYRILSISKSKQRVDIISEHPSYTNILLSFFHCYYYNVLQF